MRIMQVINCIAELQNTLELYTIASIFIVVHSSNKRKVSFHGKKVTLLNQSFNVITLEIVLQLFYYKAETVTLQSRLSIVSSNL